MLPMTRIMTESERRRLEALDRLSDTAKLAAYVGTPTKDNTDVKHPVSKLGRSCVAGLDSSVHKVRTRRINKETFRIQIARARFIPVPVLKMKDGTGRIPRKYQAKYLSK